MKNYLLPILFLCFWSCEEQDVIPPEIQITYPSSNIVVIDSVTINASATDNNGIEFVELFINGYDTDMKDYLEPYRFNWVTWDSSDGDYSIFLRAYDKSNNKTDSEIMNISVNNTFSGNMIGYIDSNSGSSNNGSWQGGSSVCFENDTRHNGNVYQFSLKVCPNNEYIIGPFEINRIINSGQTICELVSYTSNCNPPMAEVIDIIWD